MISSARRGSASPAPPRRAPSGRGTRRIVPVAALLLLTIAVTLASPAAADADPAADAEARGAPVRSAAGPEEPGPCGGPTGWKRFGCDARAAGRMLALRDASSRRNALAIGAATAFLYVAREPLRRETLEGRSEDRTDLFRSGRSLSKGGVAPLLAGAFFLTGRISGRTRLEETAQILLESSLFSAALASAGSFALAAERPEDGKSVRAFDSGGRGVSLDAALAAAVAAPLDRRHLRPREGDERWQRALRLAGRTALYSAVALAALQRMDADKHWAPDVFLGVAAGLATGHTICSAHEAPEAAAAGRPAARGVPVPAAVPGGAALVWRFDL